ncbi:hypothetical protein K2X30_10055 [bacterium]|nr:hypothetical protein [bacterium]
MLSASFNRVPRLKCFLRLLPFAGVLLYIGVATVGVVTKVPFFQGKIREVSHLKRVQRLMTEKPEFCQSDLPAQSFQAEQCQAYNEWVLFNLLIYTLPFPAPILWLAWGMARLRKEYELFQVVVNSGQSGSVAWGARVTRPARVQNDFYSWLFCLRSVSVELADKKQIVVSFPSDAVLPTSGQTVAVYAVGKRFGSERYVAQLYTPHVAVVAGSKT